MEIYYDFKKGPRKEDEGSVPRLYPHVIPNGTITSSQITELIASYTTFTAGELDGMIRMLSDTIISYLLEGYRVQLSDLGYFSLKLATDRVVTDKKELRAESIRIDNVNFRPSAEFKKRVKNGRVKRLPGKEFRKSGNLSVETRKELLTEYLKKNPYITRTQYSCLVGILKNKALQDLHTFTKEGLLIRHGRSPHMWFSLA